MAGLLRFLVIFSLLGLAPVLKSTDEDSFVVYGASLCLFSFGYVLYVMVRGGAVQQMILGLLVTLALMAGVAVLPIVFIPLLVLWVLFNLALALQTLSALKWNLLTCVLLACLLFASELFGAGQARVEIFHAGYLLVAAIYALRLMKFPLHQGLLDLSLMVLSIPLVALIVWSIMAGLRNLFGTTFSQMPVTRSVSQNVAAHMRAGTSVSAYTRIQTTTAIETVARTTAGSGAAMIGGAGSAAGAVGQSGAPGPDEGDRRRGGRGVWQQVLGLLVIAASAYAVAHLAGWLPSSGMDVAEGNGSQAARQIDVPSQPPDRVPASGTIAVTGAAPVPAVPLTLDPEPRAEAALAEASPERTGPSFDCGKAGTAVEHLVCGDDTLAELDLQLARAYRRALAASDDKTALRQEQVAWLKGQRDACGSKDCLLVEYMGRLSDLEAIIDRYESGAL